MAHKGKYRPVNPDKYQGDPTNIIWRSTWELRIMRWMDLNEDVIEWSSEELKVKYKIPYENRIRNYYPDFLATMKQKDGSIKRFMIEVKPKNQTKPPKVQKRKTQKYLKEVARWATNKSKWEAAASYCKHHDMDFVIITEDVLGNF